MAWLPALALGALLGAATPAAAHDTWVRPLPLRPPPASTLTLELSAGHGLRPLIAPRRRRLLRLGWAGDRTRRVATLRRWTRAGPCARMQIGPPPRRVDCIALTTRATLIGIADEGVDGYLAEVQPPPPLLALWQAQRAVGQPWRERYAKDAKAYLRTSAHGRCDRRLRVLRQVLELVPRSDPTRLRPGRHLPLELRQHGRAVADVALRVFDRRGERVVRTDERGRARVLARCRGRLLIATTVLQAPALAQQPWSSRFATLSLTL